nr:hypothetical protein [uncultured bacterium]
MGSLRMAASRLSQRGRQNLKLVPALMLGLSFSRKQDP